MRDEHKIMLHQVLEKAGLAGEVDVSEFHRYGSARKLYNFHIDNLGSY
jgi:methylamine---glutamate N-methyltransferase subunit B